MRTITETIRLRTFDELTPEEQEKVVENSYDLNLDHDWWDSVYEDAENVGIQINGFSLDRDRHCKISFMRSALQTAEQILKDHGKDCDTYKTAQAYMEDRKRLVVEQCQEEADRLCSPIEYDCYTDKSYYSIWDYYYQDDLDTDDIDDDFRRALQEDYEACCSGNMIT